MRKKISIVFIASTLLLTGLLTSCQFLKKEQPQQAFQQEFKIEKKTGIIEASLRTDLRATHVLKTEQNEEIPLRSGSIHLKKYEKRRVEIEGKFASADAVFEIEDITKIGNEDQTREIYRHTRLGFSAIFVPTWNITEKELGVVFTPFPAEEDEFVDRISISKLSNDKKLPPEAWLDLDAQLNAKDPADDAFYSEAFIGPDQLRAIKKTSRDSSRIDFYIQREDAIYRLNHSTIQDEDEEKYRNIFFEMINSFQFVAMSDGETQILQLPEELATQEPASPPAPSATTAPSVGSKETLETAGTSGIPVASDPPGDLTASLNSRGLGITMKYPKNWYWEQEQNKILFSDKPLDQSGQILMSLSKAKIPQQEDECKTILENQYCISVPADSPYKNLIPEMLATLKPYNAQ